MTTGSHHRERLKRGKFITSAPNRNTAKIPEEFNVPKMRNPNATVSPWLPSIFALCAQYESHAGGATYCQMP
jgi:hypothetical protein